MTYQEIIDYLQSLSNSEIAKHSQHFFKTAKGEYGEGDNEFEEALQISKLLLNDQQDLIHKAVGWMLREIGKRNLLKQTEFLKLHYKTMPRTMLRYAIEKFSKEERQKYLKGLI